MNKDDIIKKYSKSPYTFPTYEIINHFNEEDISQYCTWLNNNYIPITKHWDMRINTYWTAKFYLATKFLLFSNHLIWAYEYSKTKNLKITIPYLIYYALLTASRSLILTSPLDNKNISTKRSHENIINSTADIIARVNKEKSNYYKEIITIAKDNRELFSYKFPASGLKLINDNSADIFQQVEFVAELAILNSQVLDVLLSKIEDKSCFNIDENLEQDFYQLYDYNGKIDNKDYYNVNYISRKIKRPFPLNMMMSEGMEEDFYLNWAPETEDTNDLFIPPENTFC